jgi:UDP-N-acetylglucosamine 2-epimerase
VKKTVLIAQERSGFLKLAPLYTVLKKNGLLDPVPVLAVRSGEIAEYEALASVFGMTGALRIVPVDGGTPVGETASLMLAFEQILVGLDAEFVVPGGHDNAAIAAALAASRMGIPVVSIDAGLRSYNRAEQEEVNRLVIDSIAALHIVSEHSGAYNLINEGLSEEQLIFAGNTSIDSLVTLITESNRSEVLRTFGLGPKRFVTALFGMPFRSETAANYDLLFKVLESIAAMATVILPCAAEAVESLQETFGTIPGLQIIAMPGYVDLLRILKESAFVLTDTEEFQSELTVMSVPCLTLRESTTRPATIEVGTNLLVAWDEQEILERVSVILSRKPAGKTLIPEKWDGASAARIAAVLEKAV